MSSDPIEEARVRRGFAHAALLNAVTSPAMRARMAERFERDPNYRALHYLLGPRRILEWVHSVGVTTDPWLAECVPPVPPIRLREITSEREPALFLYAGFADLAMLIEWYTRLTPERPARPRVLDFGCGGGRLTRFLEPRQWDVAATDVNPDHVAWCAAHLPGVETHRNSPAPPTDWPADSFDLIYSFSIFSHLSGPMVAAWLGELSRLVRPDGRVILTYHGEHALKVVTESPGHQAAVHMTAEQAESVRVRLPDEGLIMRPYDEAIIARAKVGTADYGITFMSADFALESCRKHGLTPLAHESAELRRGFQDLLVLGRG